MSCSDEKKLVRLSAYAEHYGCSLQGIKRRCQNGEMKTGNKNWKNMDDRYKRGATSRQEIDKRFFC